MPARPVAEAQALALIEQHRKQNLEQMFAGTRMALKLTEAKQRLKDAEQATVKTTQAGVGTAGLFLDLGAATGPAVAAGAAIARLTIKIHWAGREFKEVRAANRILSIPGELTRQGSELFGTAPLLGCYLLSCSNTSDILNILVSDIGSTGFMDRTEQMEKKIDPLLEQASRAIIDSPYTPSGLRTNQGEPYCHPRSLRS